MHFDTFLLHAKYRLDMIPPCRLTATPTFGVHFISLEIYSYRIKKYIGAYAVAMGGVDAIIFTGGVGENSSTIRKQVCSDLEFIGVEFDEDSNSNIKLKEFEVAIATKPSSKVKVLITKTREQWMIAKDTYNLLTNS